MGTERMEAFSDGVIAILITIMVLELHIPNGSGLRDLHGDLPVFLTYLLSFVNVGIYWNNHHHLLQVTKRVNGTVLWANLHLLFWLSLFPFFTGWMGQHHWARIPVAAYGLVSLLAGIAYYLLQLAIMASDGADSTLRHALGRDLKGKASPILYAVAIPTAFINRWVAVALYVVVAVMWIVPDRRLEIHASGQDHGRDHGQDHGQDHGHAHDHEG